MKRRETEYSLVRRQRRETPPEEHPTPVQGVRTQTAEMTAAIAAARLLDAIRAAGMDGQVRAEVLVDVHLQLTADEAHLVAAAIVAALQKSGG